MSRATPLKANDLAAGRDGRFNAAGQTIAADLVLSLSPAAVSVILGSLRFTREYIVQKDASRAADDEADGFVVGQLDDLIQALQTADKSCQRIRIGSH